MGLLVTFRGRPVKRRHRTADGLRLVLFGTQPGTPGEVVLVTDDEWAAHGSARYVPNLTRAEVRRMAFGAGLDNSVLESGHEFRIEPASPAQRPSYSALPSEDLEREPSYIEQPEPGEYPSQTTFYKSFHDCLEQLQQINVTVRHRFELAEARIPQANALIAQLGAAGLLNVQSLLGEVIFDRAYGPQGPIDSCQILQSALLIPEGFGVVCWDMEDFLEFRAFPWQWESQRSLAFTPFEECSPVAKAMLLPCVESLLNRVCRGLECLPNLQLGNA